MLFTSVISSSLRAAGFGLADLFKDRGVVEIQTSHRIVRFGCFGLFFDAENFSTGDFRAAETFRIRDFLEDDMRAGGLFLEGLSWRR